jgi:uncharacterized membrane protein
MMSTQTIPPLVDALHSPAKLRRGLGLAVIEGLIAGLWLAGSLRYTLQHGPHGLPLLAFASCLLLPHFLKLTAFAVRPASGYCPALWLYLLGIFLPEHLGGAGKIVAPHLVPLLLASIGFAAQLIVNWLRDRPLSLGVLISPARWLTFFVVIYSVVGCFLAIAKLHAFGYVGQDIGYFMQCLYTGLHGKLFASNQYHDLLYTRTVSSDFAGHNQPVLFLLLPVYWLYPHAETLFLVRNIFLGLSAYPVYRLARLYLAELPASLMVIAFLLAPALLFQNFYDYAPLSLVGLPLLFCLLFYYQRRYVPYIASLILCLFVREDLVFVAMGMGLIALISRRRFGWSVAPLTIGLLWGLFTWKLLLPHFQQGAVSAVDSCFSYLGSSPGEMLHTMVLRPQLVITHKAVIYLKQIFTPFGIVLPFWSPASLVALPYLLINVAGDPGCNAAIVFRHYSLIPSALLLPGVLIAVRWIAARPLFRTPTQTMIAFTLFLASAGTTALSIGNAELHWWHRALWQQEAAQLATTLPDSAAVAVPRYMLPLTANRDRVYQSLRLLDYNHPAADYIVIDRDSQRMGVTGDWQPHFDELLRQLHDSTRFNKVYESANFEIYQRTGAHLVSLRPGSDAR